ncbi:transporter [Ganoderma sinense ZZ0214-1]|uniref:non-specific serine/threonine protein kinase n=1 Tax=Ganoderma sinense ZZ0214-1 TaxID=1077348 RepID=A0A2G8RZB3_9APHY|nr:transporter [Ganoderma sinense ZZ0214-1]
MRISYGKEHLGSGRHGQVYAATSTMAARSDDVGRVFALKKTAVTNHVRHPMLLHEACALVLLRGHPSVPRVVAWGRSQYFEYLVMDRLGSTLDQTLKTIEPHRLTLRNAIVLVCQMLDVIEHVHEKGIVHCDIKPRNFVFGTKEHAGRLHLIDFGLSRPWIDPTTRKPFPEDANFGFRGTLHFASRHVHLGHTPSRRDDMESLAYILVKLLTGTLPWADTKETEDLLPILFAYSGKTLCEGYDDVFARFVDDVLGLQYDETPKYQYWRQAFRDVVPGLPVDAVYDPEDDSEPHVGVPPKTVLRCDDHPKPAEREPEDSDPLLERVLGGASRSKDGGQHGFAPNWGSSWLGASAIRAGDVFGDEFAIVNLKEEEEEEEEEEGGVEFIDVPPDYSHGSAAYAGMTPLEEMKNDQSSTRCI